MVTAALRHCLINMIALEIMVTVIYLCNIMELVIVHVVQRYRHGEHRRFWISFLWSKKRKWQIVDLGCSWTPRPEQWACGFSVRLLLGRYTPWHYLGTVEDGWDGWVSFTFFFLELPKGLMESISRYCLLMFTSASPVWVHAVTFWREARVQSVLPEDGLIGRRTSPWCFLLSHLSVTCTSDWVTSLPQRLIGEKAEGAGQSGRPASFCLAVTLVVGECSFIYFLTPGGLHLVSLEEEGWNGGQYVFPFVLCLLE